MENLTKFFYDCGKVAFAVLIIGNLAKRSYLLGDVAFGIGLTLVFIISGAILEKISEAKG